jgi:hypothetical protein
MTDQPEPDAEPKVPREHTEGTEPLAAEPVAAESALTQHGSAPSVALTKSGETVRRHRSRIWSNLNLNGPVPARVRPTIGEWGPRGLPSTKQKKRARWIVPLAFTLAVCALLLLGWYFWLAFR